MINQNETEKELVFSYLAHRRVIGYTGALMPLMVSLGAYLIFDTGIQFSISKYYHTGTREIFVGTLWVIGFFLLSYNGHGKIDPIAGKLGCLFALCTTLFPTALSEHPSGHEQLIGNIHITFAALFFGVLIFFSVYLFRKTDKGDGRFTLRLFRRPGQADTRSRVKVWRDALYLVCGLGMAACLLLIALFLIFFNDEGSCLPSLHPVFWLEATAIVLFGLSWLTKGQAILKDVVTDGRNEIPPAHLSL
jgi:hypothetical protein